jgi:segregation and condensation protein A
VTVAETLRVKTDVFEGPIDLLLTLAQRRQLDLNEVRLADLTSDFLAALDGAVGGRPAEEMAAFLVFGSRLLALKAAALLPEPLTEEEPDPLAWEAQVKARMLEYSRFKEAASELMRRHSEGSFSFASAIEAQIIPTEQLQINGDGLAAAFQKVLDRLPPPSEVQFDLRHYSLAEEVDAIRRRLSVSDLLNFTDLFDRAESRLHAVVIFLALLELVRLGEAGCRQRGVFGDIEVSRGAAFAGLTGSDR